MSGLAISAPPPPRRMGSSCFPAGKIDVTDSNFQKVCVNLIILSEICVARSLFEALRVRVREGSFISPIVILNYLTLMK